MRRIFVVPKFGHCHSAYIHFCHSCAGRNPEVFENSVDACLRGHEVNAGKIAKIKVALNCIVETQAAAAINGFLIVGK